MTDQVKTSPNLQGLIAQLIEQAATVDSDVLAAISGHGLNLPVDLKAIQDAASFFQWFRSDFLPVLKDEFKANAPTT